MSPGHDDVAVRVDAPAEDGEDIHDVHVPRDPATLRREYLVALVGYLETPPARPADLVELRLDPAPRGPDPSRIGDGVGEGVPCPEAGECADVRLDSPRRGRDRDFVQPGVERGRDLGEAPLRLPREGEGAGAREDDDGSSSRAEPSDPSNASTTAHPTCLTPHEPAPRSEVFRFPRR